jgi:hypothetical protein
VKYSYQVFYRNQRTGMVGYMVVNTAAQAESEMVISAIFLSAASRAI